LTLAQFGQLASQEVWGGNANAWNQPQQPAAATWPTASYGAPVASNNWGWQQQQNNNNGRPWYNNAWVNTAPNMRPAAAAAVAAIANVRGVIHQLLSIISKLRILVLLPVSALPYVVIVKNYSLW
jgi:hypothetical protein